MKTVLVGRSPHLLEKALNHNHGDWEVLINTEGTGTAMAGNQKYDFYPGSIICIPPLVYHSKSSDDKFIDIYFSIKNLPFKNEVIILQDDESKTIENLALTAYRFFNDKSKNNELIIDYIITTIVHILLSWYHSKPQNDNVEEIKKLLHKNFTNPGFKLSDAIKSTGYCADYFRKCFKNETGLSPLNYLNNLRIEYAKYLIMGKKSTKLSISDIAIQSGFNDARYFSKIFKKHVGKAPQDFASEF